jgi:hypothetical protein
MADARPVYGGRTRPVVRLAVTAAFLLLAAILIWIAFRAGTDTDEGALLINLGTEVMGIVITVAVIEWFVERRRLQTRGRQLAWDALHAVEHAVWVWQGGPREMDTDDLLGVLKAVGEADPLPDFTEGLFLNLGTRARRLLSNDPEAVEAVLGFANGLEHLARLSAIRDGNSPMKPRKVADILEQGTSDLARALGKATDRHLASLIRYRDPGAASQERRHFGVRGALTWPTSVEPGTLE